MVSSQTRNDGSSGTSSPGTGKIFLSYRRDDSAGYAHALSRRLREKFGRESVFMDVDTINMGDDFVEALDGAVAQCAVLLALIGREWVSSADAAGRRLDHDNDFVRLEITKALERKVKVIPVLIDGASMPNENELPSVLAPLTRRNAFILSPTAFDADADRFVEKLVPILPPHPADVAPRPPHGLRRGYPWVLMAATVAYAVLNAMLGTSGSVLERRVADGALPASILLVVGSLLLLAGVGRAWLIAAGAMILQLGIPMTAPHGSDAYAIAPALFFGVLTALYWRAGR